MFFLYMRVETDDRENIREITEKSDNALLLLLTLFQRINIRNLHNIIFASPSKSRIRNLQSIVVL
ncbi:MAG: hypothetical protein CM15mV25_0910 [uncultured marine virus]|nr:MAG: hypothetical protein CM15mV25_0910 [uncultured marine virus]